MLFNLEPDQSVTGGSWYSDQDFESEFVDVLNQQCFKFLQQQVYKGVAQKNRKFNSKIGILVLQADLFFSGRLAAS